jgi:glycosyltransferase involved in cell wall biosynthesis
MVGDMWLEDLRAQAKAIRDAGMELIVTTPLLDTLDSTNSGSFNAVEIRPEDQGFRYEPLPFFISLKQYLQQRAATKKRLEEVIARADIIHCGYGGHPVALGELAWPIARRMGKKTIWIFDGADPFPRMELHVSQQKNPIKRWALGYLLRRFAAVSREAVVSADLVFSHNAATVERYKDIWDARRCFAFDRSFVTDAIVISDAELAERQQRLMDASQPLRLVAAGRQIAIKATDHVLRAMRQAIDRGVKLELNVLGDGEDLDQFKALATELRLNDVVRFGGTVPYGQPLFDIWAQAHVMVITNLTAEISRNVLLAMARGLPLVMYANPGTDELIRQSGAGMLVPRGDVDALSRAFEQAARDRAALAQMCAKGLEVARRNTLDATHRRRAELAAALIPRA